MRIVDITPYSPIEQTRFANDTVIELKAASFAGIQFDAKRSTISFFECSFRKVTIQNSEDIDFENITIQFSGCYIDDIRIEKIKSHNISINFFASIVSGVIKSKQIDSISINNCICKSLFISNQKNVNISYTEENVFPLLWKKVLEIANTTFPTIIKEKQSIYIYDTINITFTSSEESDNKIGLYRRRYDALYLCKVGYYFTTDQKDTFDINLSISYTEAIQKQETKISNSRLNSLSISGKTAGSISIENTKINQWYVSDFISKGEVSFYNIHPFKGEEERIIGMHKCNLDDVWFDNVDFDKYQRISFYRTKLAKSVFTSCNFPQEYSSFERFMPIKNVHYPERKSQNHHKDQYEIFLQLKMSLESTGNYFEAQKLQAIAHDALIKINPISTGDKVILHINSFSNNHGLSIARPLVWFLTLSILIYLTYLFSLGRLFNSNEIDYDLIGYYFSFIDITHRNDFLVDKDEFNVFSLTIDYLGKVVFGFLIYQFIAAFRKYGKK